MKPLGHHLICKQSLMINHFLHWKWFFLALLVGSILNLVNQFDGLFGQTELDYLKLAVTYVVPYCVSSMTSWHALKA